MNLLQSYQSLIDRLARVTTSGRRIRELDGLRFIAIATVLIQHVYEIVGDRTIRPDLPPDDVFALLVKDWRIGVELFFLISGFILGMPFARQHIFGGEKVSLAQYYWRRITRLEPPYVLAMCLWFAVLVLYWKESARDLFPHLIASLGYFHNLKYGGFSTINAVAWSLEIEVQFYVLAPLLALVFLFRQPWLRRSVLVVFSLLLIESFKPMNHYLPALAQAGGPAGTLLSHLPLFLMGFVLADVYLVDWRQAPPRRLWCDVLAITGWLLLPFYFRQLPMLHRTVLPPITFPFIMLGLCWTSLQGPIMRRFLGNSFIMTTGGMCYTIYLLHLPLFNILGRYSPVPLVPGVRGVGINTVLYTVIWCIPLAAMSIAFFLLVEKPCMQKNWPQKLAARLSGKSKPVP